MGWSSVNNIAEDTLNILKDLGNPEYDIYEEELESLRSNSAGLFATMRSCGLDWRSVEREYGNYLVFEDLNDLSKFSNFSARILRELGYDPGKPREEFHGKVKGFEKILKKISCGLESPYSLRNNRDYNVMVSFLKRLKGDTNWVLYQHDEPDD